MLHREATGLRLAKVERQVGGVRFEGTLRDAWRANLHFRTAIRVLLRVARFPAANDDALYRGVQEIDWRRFLASDGRLVVAAQTNESDLDHSLFVEQRTKDAIVDQFLTRGGTRPSVDKESPDLGIHVHLWRNRCTVSVDTSGVSLHKRGWRRFQGQAPLAETLAAAIVLFSGWDRRAPLLDPFCGSGTLLTEAGLMAGGVPPGAFRSEFGFERFPGHDVAGWQALRTAALQEQEFPRRLTLRGCDSDAEAIDGARENLDSAGLTGKIELEVGDALDMELKAGWNAWIVTNPPYGERVGSESQLLGLYRAFGDLLRERAGGYRLALLSGNPQLTQALGLEGGERANLLNGAIPCELLRLEVPARTVE